VTALPKPLADDLARVRRALETPAAGPDVLSARESLDRIEAALAASWAAQARFSSLAGYVFRLGVELRAYLVDCGDGVPKDQVLAAMCDAEERATK